MIIASPVPSWVRNLEFTRYSVGRLQPGLGNGRQDYSVRPTANRASLKVNARVLRAEEWRSASLLCANLVTELNVFQEIRRAFRTRQCERLKSSNDRINRGPSSVCSGGHAGRTTSRPLSARGLAVR